MRLRSIAGGLTGLALLAARAVAADPTPLAEHQIKALYLFNFTKYVDWPVAATNAQPFVIGLAGAQDVKSDLAEIIKGKQLQGREIVIRPVATPAELKGCHILFIGDGNRQRIGELLRAVQGTAVLTVGEVEGFLTLGGMINFTNQGNRVKLEIGLDNVQQARLNMSAKLLAVANVLRSRPELPRK